MAKDYKRSNLQHKGPRLEFLSMKTTLNTFLFLGVNESKVSNAKENGNQSRNVIE